MLSSAIIVFREVLEAAMVIGIVAAATRGLPRRGQWIAGGIVLGGIGAMLVAALMQGIANLASGIGQELLNASILGLAAIMLGWHNIWMASHGAQLARESRQIGADVSEGNRHASALCLLIALCIFREGAETVLFLQGVVASEEQSVSEVIMGGALGMAGGMATGAALYAGMLKIPTKWFFKATGIFILLLAASMASQMAKFLVQADILPSLATPLWDSSWLLSNSSPVATVLHALAGYDARPTGMQMVFYFVTFVLVASGMRITHPKPCTQSA
jgi:high-affinity iron transporter